MTATGTAPQPPAFGSLYGDHMFCAEFQDGAWRRPEIRPFGPLPLSPSISGLHYGQAIFEGMKVHRSPSDDILLFRPADHARRLRRSAERMAMPPVPEALFLDGLRELLRRDADVVPAPDTGALYVRPVQFSTDPSIRVKPGDRYQFVVITAPMFAYFPASIDVLVSMRYVRAFPGGTGDVKPAGNYGPTLIVEAEARAAGCDTTMWLDGLEHRYVEECGVLNPFFVLGDRIVTPAPTGTILAGIVRDSAITLLRAMGHAVEERPIAIDEVAAAHADGRLRECFGTATAATLTHVGRIRYGDRDLVLPPVGERRIGPALRERLLAIMQGRARDDYGWVVKV